MSGPTRSMLLGIDANTYRPLLDAVHAMATKYEQHVSTFKGYVDKPGGTAWEGQTAEASQHNAGDGWKVAARIQDLDTKFQTTAGMAVDHTIVPELRNCQTMIENIEAQRNKGLTLTEDLQVGYDPPPGVSEKLAAENAKVAQARGEELRESARKWHEAEQEVKRLAEGVMRDIENEVNGAAGTFDIGKAVKDNAPRTTDPNASTVNYKDMYPKESAPAGTQAAAATAVDPHAPVLGPPSPGDKPFQPDPRAGGLTDKLGVMGITEPKSPVDKPAPPPDARTVSAPKLDMNNPADKAAIDKFRSMLSTQLPPDQVEAKVADAIKGAQQDRPMVSTPEPGTPPERARESFSEAFHDSWDKGIKGVQDLVGANGLESAKDAWKDMGTGIKDSFGELAHPTEVSPERIDNAHRMLDNPKAFLGEQAAIAAQAAATAPLGGEAALARAGLEDAAVSGVRAELTHGIPEPHTPAAVEHHAAPPPLDHPAPVNGPDHPAPTNDHPSGPFPPHGEPGAYGYDTDGNRLPYANGGRPGYAADQEATTFDITRHEQLSDIANGVTKLPPPGPSEVWVRLMDDAEGPGVRMTETGERYGLVQWEPGMPRKEVWDMGHVPGSEYRYVKELYMSGQITYEQFMNEVKNPNNYRVEDWLRNRSHVDEGP